MTHASAPHKPLVASERQGKAKKAKDAIAAALGVFSAKLRQSDERIRSPHQVAAELGAQAAVVKLAYARTAELEQSRAAAPRAASGASVRGAAAGTSPTSNTGGKPASVAHVQTVELIQVDGQTKIVAVRAPAPDDCAMIDTISVVCHIDTLFKTLPLNRSELGGIDSNYDDAVLGFASTFSEIFGVSITRKFKAGRNYYKHAYEIGDGLGHIAMGGNEDTFQIHLNGTGCFVAAPGWEKRLHDWMVKHAEQPRISRIDLAHDDLQGVLTVDDMFVAYHAGLFTNGGRPPKCDLRGDWICPDGAGRTLYVGSRDNGLLYRGYEKGKEQGDPTSEWVRHEVQLGNKCRFIPFDILLHPGSYFAGAYTSLVQFSDDQHRIKTQEKAVEASLEHVIEVAKNQVGRAINLLMDVFNNDAALVVQKIIREGHPKSFQYLEADHWQEIEIEKPTEAAIYEQAFSGESPRYGSRSDLESVPSKKQSMFSIDIDAFSKRCREYANSSMQLAT